MLSLGRCPKPLKNRDVVTLRSWLPMGSDYIIMNYSVKHPVSSLGHQGSCGAGWGWGSLRAWRGWRVEGVKTALIVAGACCTPPALPLTHVPSWFPPQKYPPRKDMVRAVSIQTGYLIEGTGAKSCTITYLAQVDPKGKRGTPSSVPWGSAPSSPSLMSVCAWGGSSGVLGEFRGCLVEVSWVLRVGSLRVQGGLYWGLIGALGSVGPQGGLRVAQWGFSWGSGTSVGLQEVSG